MQEHLLRGMTKINFMIIIIIGFVIFVRSFFYLTVDCSTIVLIINYEESQAGSISYPLVWIIFRGIIAPILYTTELSMVSYMIYH
jgi:hypothetical protein